MRGKEGAALLDVVRRVLGSVGTVRAEWEIFEVAVQAGARRLGYDWVSLVLNDLDEGTAHLFLAVPASAGVLRMGEAIGAGSGFHEVIRTGRPFLRTSLDRDGPRWEDGALRALGVASYAAVPLSARGRVVGTYNVGVREAQRLDGDLALLVSFGEFLATAVAADRMLREMAAVDARLRERVVWFPALLPREPDLP